MEFQLKTLSPEAVPHVLSKAERYRLLNEPGEAESICRDALAIERDNQAALTTLVLALTDQFDADTPTSVSEAWHTVERITNDYDRAYYSGLIHERRAKAHLRRGSPGSGPLVYDWLREAMSWYDRAEAIRPPGNDDAILRWNTCARLIMGDRKLAPATESQLAEPLMLE
jgi:hypothetical protein